MIESLSASKSVSVLPLLTTTEELVLLILCTSMCVAQLIHLILEVKDLDLRGSSPS